MEDNPGSQYRQRFGSEAEPRAPSRYIHAQQEGHDRPNKRTQTPPTPYIYTYLYIYFQEEGAYIL